MQEPTLHIQAIDAPNQPSSVATLLAWSGEQVEIASNISAPPGARIQARVVEMAVPEGGSQPDPDVATAVAFRIKVHRCRRRQEGDYVLAGRILDLHRTTQEALSLLPSPSR